MDGNKRTAWVTTKAFLFIHNIFLKKIRHADIADFVEGIAIHKYSHDEITQWFRDNMKN